MTDSFWNIPKESLQTPLSIFRSQADSLSTATSGLLQGDISVQQPGGRPESLIYLRIIVPALNNFKFDVLTYVQPLLLYPGNIIFNNKSVVINSEGQLIDELRKILSSDQIGKITQSLIAQARSV